MRCRSPGSTRGSTPCATAPIAAASDVAKKPPASAPAALRPSAAAASPKRAVSTKATIANRTSVSTVTGSVMPPQRGRFGGACVATLGRIRQQRDVVPVPVALESLVGIVVTLEAEELWKLRIAAQQLLARAEGVVREEPAPLPARRDVDQPAKRVRRMPDAVRCVMRVEIEDRAGVRRLRPGEEALVIALDETNGAVDAVHAVQSEVVRCLGEEIHERLARHVQLTDDFRRRMLGFRLLVEPGVVVVDVRAELVRVGPVHLAIGAEVVLGVGVPGALLVDVGEPQQLLPVGRRERTLLLGDRRIVRCRLVTREDTAAQKVVGPRVERELEVPELVALGYTFVEACHEAIGRLDLDGAPYLVPRDEAQRDRVDEAEESVAPADELEERRVLGATADETVAARGDERQRLDVGDERTQRQAAAVHVGRDRTANAQAIRTGLLLVDAPL